MITTTWALGLAAMLGALAGLATAVLAIWLPQRILNEENHWIAHLKGETPQALTPHRLSECVAYAWQGRRKLLALVGMGMAIGTILVALRGASWPTLLWAAWVWTLLTAALIDARTQLLPDALTLPLLWAGLLVQSVDGLAYLGLQQAVWGAAAGYLVLWALEWLYVWRRGQSGVGQGDMKLMAAIGAWLGPQAIPQVLLLAALGSLLWQYGRRGRQGLSGQSEFAFGPWIALGAVAWLAWSMG
ncbi:A24 family peptidase [Hydrogenophaga sp.]|uniref:prepilin peptidase n=1 Tax=Hydrogenophaga sp. TaxID=1904254 RepID=UPI0035B28527